MPLRRAFRASANIAGRSVEHHAPSEAEQVDPLIYAKAEAAATAATCHAAAELEAIRADKSLTTDQRAAAVCLARQRHRQAAAAARHRVIDDEKSRARAEQQKRPNRPNRMDQGGKFRGHEQG